MKILVTGGTGFIGSYTTRSILESGNVPIAFDNKPNFILLNDIKDRVRIETGDILDLGSIRNAISNNSVDCIIHAAGITIARANQDHLLSFKVNGEGTFNVLEAARMTGIKRVVFVSSNAVYGSPSSEIEVREDSPTNPYDNMAIMKLLGENLGKFYQEKYGVEFCALRFPVLWGAGKSIASLHIINTIEDLITDALSKRKLTLVENPSVDWLYCKDATLALVKASIVTLKSRRNTNDHRDNVYNWGYGKLFSLEEIAQSLTAIDPTISIEVPEHVSSSKSLLLDCSRAKEELGLEIKYTLRKATSDYLETLRTLSLPK